MLQMNLLEMQNGFLYINKYRNDIDAYWICDNLDAINTIKKWIIKLFSQVHLKLPR